MAGLLSMSMFAQATNVAERRLQLVDLVIAFAQALVKQGYTEAQEEAGTLYGTVSDLYTELTTYGYRAFLANNPEIEQEAIRLMDRFEHGADEIAEIQAAIDAWNQALQDPHNINGWLHELKIFSLALMKVATDNVDAILVIHPQTKERIVLNNGKFVSAADRIKMGSYMVVTIARHSQRYNAMGHDAYMQFADGRPASAYSALVASLPAPK
jgi:hypothetical protein